MIKNILLDVRFGSMAAFQTTPILEKRQLPLGVDGCLLAEANIGVH